MYVWSAFGIVGQPIPHPTVAFIPFSSLFRFHSWEIMFRRAWAIKCDFVLFCNGFAIESLTSTRTPYTLKWTVQQKQKHGNDEKEKTTCSALGAHTHHERTDERTNTDHTHSCEYAMITERLTKSVWHFRAAAYLSIHFFVFAIYFYIIFFGAGISFLSLVAINGWTRPSSRRIWYTLSLPKCVYDSYVINVFWHFDFTIDRPFP